MNKKIRTEAVSRLFEAILTLESEEECFLFFEDLCTVNELLSLSQRFEVASMLKKKETYLRIAEKTGASTATISRVNRSLIYGNDGYDIVFGRMKSYQGPVGEAGAAEMKEKTGRKGKSPKKSPTGKEIPAGEESQAEKPDTSQIPEV